MNRAIIVNWHKYTPFGDEFYQPLLETFIKNLTLFKDEFDVLYLVDDVWNFIAEDKERISKIVPTVFFKSNASLTPHKQLLPIIKEDSILKLDQDVIIYKKGIIDSWFKKIEDGYDVVAAFDSAASIGIRKAMQDTFPFLKEHNVDKISSAYHLLKKEYWQDANFSYPEYKGMEEIKDINYITQKGDWFESYGLWTIQILKKNPKIYVLEDDRSSIYLADDGIKKDPLKANNLGYYHIRAGTTAIHALATKHYDSEEKYYDILKAIPKVEMLRHCAWYKYLGGNPTEIIFNLGEERFEEYYKAFLAYHGLEDNESNR